MFSVKVTIKDYHFKAGTDWQRVATTMEKHDLEITMIEEDAWFDDDDGLEDDFVMKVADIEPYGKRERFEYFLMIMMYSEDNFKGECFESLKPGTHYVYFYWKYNHEYDQDFLYYSHHKPAKGTKWIQNLRHSLNF